MNTFEFAQGSVGGRDHRLSGRNNQDALFVFVTSQVAIALVADGCGSGGSSEIGARLGVRILADLLQRRFAAGWTLPRDQQDLLLEWNLVRDELLRALRSVADHFGGCTKTIVEDYLLFTLMIAVITPDEALFLAAGDGCAFVNGEEVSPPEAPGNAPSYLSYGLRLPPDRQPTFQVLRRMPTRELSSFLIGSDGFKRRMQAVGKTYPGTDRLIEPVEDLWTNDRFFRNPDILRRHLTLVNRDASDVRWEEHEVDHQFGYLNDDTTLIVGRRRKEV